MGGKKALLTTTVAKTNMGQIIYFRGTRFLGYRKLCVYSAEMRCRTHVGCSNPTKRICSLERLIVVV